VLPLRDELSGNGFTTKKLACGDWIVTVRRDGANSVCVLGLRLPRKNDAA
jgi:hypothetical protein